jgi:stage II sporulation protein D
LTARSGVQVVVYPTLDAYRDATGEPGFLLASTRGSTIRLQPLERLRARSALDSTILHEMLHVILEQKARNPLPRWFVEGLVVTLSGENTGPAAWTPDVEHTLAAPPDQARLRAAYAAAATRVRALIARHGQAVVLGWVETGLSEDVNRAITAR